MLPVMRGAPGEAPRTPSGTRPRGSARSAQAESESMIRFSVAEGRMTPETSSGFGQ